MTEFNECERRSRVPPCVCHNAVELSVTCSARTFEKGTSRLRLLVSSLLFLTVCSPASPVCAKAPIGTLDGMVISVSDGDHLTFSNNGTEINVRLYGIKAPVIAKIRRDEPWHTQPGQRFAGRAFMALARKVLHKQARLEIMQMEDRERAMVSSSLTVAISIWSCWQRGGHGQLGAGKRRTSPII